MRGIEDRRERVPGGNVGKGVGTKDEEQLTRTPPLRMKTAQRVDRVRPSLPNQLRIRHPVRRNVVYGERNHGKAMKGRCMRFGGPERGAMRGQEQHVIERQRRPRCAGRVEVTDMNGIERAAEDAESSRHRSRGTISVSSDGGAAASRTAAIWRHAASRSASTPSPVTPEMR